MTPDVQRSVAFIAARAIGGMRASTVYDYAAGTYTHFSGSVEQGRVSIYDHGLGHRVIGNLPNLYHTGGGLSLAALMDIGARFESTNVPLDTRDMTPEQAAEYLWRRFVSHLEI